MRKGLCADLSSADFIPARPDYVRRGIYWYLERRLTVAQRWPPKSPSDPYSSWQLESCPPSGEHTPRPARPSSTTSEGPQLSPILSRMRTPGSGPASCTPPTQGSVRVWFYRKTSPLGISGQLQPFEEAFPAS